MKATKHLWLILLLMGLLLLLCGCETKQTPAAPQKELQKITVGINDHIKHKEYREKGDEDALDIELAREVFRRMGYDMDIVVIYPSSMEKMMENGTIDCMINCLDGNYNPDLYAVTEPYINARQVVMVNANSDIDTLDDLEDKRVGVVLDGYAEHYFDEHRKTGTTVAFSTLSEGVDALTFYHAEAVAGDESALFCLTSTKHENYRILAQPLIVGKKVIVFNKSRCGDLASRANEALAQMREDGFIADAIERHGMDPIEKLSGIGDER